MQPGYYYGGGDGSGGAYGAGSSSSGSSHLNGGGEARYTEQYSQFNGVEAEYVAATSGGNNKNPANYLSLSQQYSF